MDRESIDFINKVIADQTEKFFKFSVLHNKYLFRTQMGSEQLQKIINNSLLLEKVYQKSKWLVELIVRLFIFDEQISLKTDFTEDEYEKIKNVVCRQQNVNKIGSEYI